jgi:hypothetical protein
MLLEFFKSLRYFFLPVGLENMLRLLEDSPILAEVEQLIDLMFPAQGVIVRTHKPYVLVSINQPIQLKAAATGGWLREEIMRFARSYDGGFEAAAVAAGF